jgi:hypothetical protein
VENRFDELAKSLAGSVSRRDALVRLGGGMAGLLLASLGMRKAWSDPATNSQCEDFCRTHCNIDPGGGNAFGECVSSCEACVNSTGALPCGCPASPGAAVRCRNCGCFIAGTRVTMADGREKPIEQLRVGEQVLGPEGEVNRVVEIRRPRLGTRRLYSLNGGAHFVTAAHPFMTSEGWKAVDPAATARENPLLQVAPLRVGDLLVAMQPARVLAAAGGVALAEPLVPALVSVALASLEARTDDPDTTLYNPRLDGSHAYFAAGFLVHNK